MSPQSIIGATENLLTTGFIGFTRFSACCVCIYIFLICYCLSLSLGLHVLETGAAAHIRIMQKGDTVYQESQALDRKTMALQLCAWGDHGRPPCLDR
ncbi:hypothetical protein D3C79_936380 [compost metagenome]